MIKFHLGLKRLSAWGALKEAPTFAVGPLCFLNGRRLPTHSLAGKAGFLLRDQVCNSRSTEGGRTIKTWLNRSTACVGSHTRPLPLC